MFRSGNLMYLSEGRLQELIETNRTNDTAFACHQTLPYNSTYAAEGQAVCRGYYDAYGGSITPLMLATSMGMIEEDDPPEKLKEGSR